MGWGGGVVFLEIWRKVGERLREKETKEMYKRREK